MSLRPADLLGVPAADLLQAAPLFRYGMVCLVVAWAVVVARARPAVAIPFGAVYALAAAGYWMLVLGRPYGLLVDPVLTRRLAECAVAASSGGWEGVLSGEPARGMGAWLCGRVVSPGTATFAPTLLAPLVVPVVGLMLYHLWSRRDRAWLGALLWMAFPAGDLDGLRGTGVLSGAWAHPLGALGLMASVLAVLMATRSPRGGRWVAAGLALSAAWLVAGVQWARLGEPVTRLGAFDRLAVLTLDQGLWLPLGAFGLLRRGEPSSRALALAGAILLLVPATALARVEPWGAHALYRAGLITAAAGPAVELCTGAGAALKRALSALAATPDARVGAAAALLALAPGSFPVWWQPVQLDPVFADSLVPVPEVTAEAARAVAAHTGAGAVVLAGPEYAPAVAALSGRRLLRAPWLSPVDSADAGARWRAEERTLAGRAGGPAARRFGVTHVLAAVGDFAEHGIEAPEQLADRPGFRLVWAHPEGLRLYALEAAAGP